MATRWDDTRRRWFVDGEPVHAGAALELRGVVVAGYDDNDEPRMGPGEWFTVRIESRDGGRVLDAYSEIHGVTFCARAVAGFDGDEPFSTHALRWPVGDGRVDEGRFGR
ncbi:MAG: hypothetical protein ACRBN8_46245 [Nannocystales bacterium]